MGDITQSAFGLRQALGGLDKKLEQRKVEKARGAQADLLRQEIGGTEGEIIAGDVESGAITGTGALKAQAQFSTFQHRINALSKKALNPKLPEEERLLAKKMVGDLVNMQAAIKRRISGGSGAGSPKDLGRDKAYVKATKALIQNAVNQGKISQQQALQWEVKLLNPKATKEFNMAVDPKAIRDFMDVIGNGNNTPTPSSSSGKNGSGLRKSSNEDSAFDEAIND